MGELEKTLASVEIAVDRGGEAQGPVRLRELLQRQMNG